MSQKQNNKRVIMPQDKNDPKWWKLMGEIENNNSENNNVDDEETK